jgi:hypothetical protein
MYIKQEPRLPDSRKSGRRGNGYPMPGFIVLFNHTLTPAQEESAFRSLAVDDIISPPAEVRRLWSQVPPAADSLADYLSPVKTWLDSTARPGDFVLVQGEFGATFIMVNHCLQKGYVPIYSTTSRRAMESHLADGTVEVRHVFSHVRFRRYVI